MVQNKKSKGFVLVCLPEISKTAPVINGLGSRTYLAILSITGLFLIGYGIERLYVTPKESIRYTINQSLSSTTNKDIDQLNRFLHDQFFEKDPPPLLINVLRRNDPESSDTFTRNQLKRSLKNFLQQTNVKRNVIMDQDISIDDNTASVNLSVLTFFVKDDTGSNRLEDKFLSKWKLQLIRTDDRWQITDLQYRN